MNFLNTAVPTSTIFGVTSISSCAIVSRMSKTPFERFQEATAKILATPKEAVKKPKKPRKK
jgi:hypothetical protein